MKKFICFLLFSFALLLAMPPSESKAMCKNDPGTSFVIDQSQTAPAALVQEQETGGVAVEQAQPGDVVPANDVKDFFLKNWFELLSGFFLFLHVVVKLTPTEKDNDVLKWIVNLLNVFIPNYKKGGGTFKVPSN